MNAEAYSLQPGSALPPPLPRAALGEWKPEYSVGIGIIDQQHQRIFELLAQLREAVGRQQKWAALLSVLNQLIESTRLHFASEEVLMQAFGYPESLPHQLEHDRLSVVILEFQEQFEPGREQLAETLLDFMTGWLVCHILSTDQRYAGFFAERGAKP